MASPIPRRPQTEQQHGSFIEGPWLEDEPGVITAPDNLSDENLAIYTLHAYGDIVALARPYASPFMWETGSHV